MRTSYNPSSSDLNFITLWNCPVTEIKITSNFPKEEIIRKNFVNDLLTLCIFQSFLTGYFQMVIFLQISFIKNGHKGFFFFFLQRMLVEMSIEASGSIWYGFFPGHGGWYHAHYYLCLTNSCHAMSVALPGCTAPESL